MPINSCLQTQQPPSLAHSLQYPSASSPMEEAAAIADDESSASSFASSTAPGSPILPIHQQRHAIASGQIEVPVLDGFSANSTSLLHPPTIMLEIPSSIGKCLSPIREMPTPLPSPALTPALMRRVRSGGTICRSRSEEDEDEEEEEEERRRKEMMAIDPHAEDGLILEEAAAMQNKTKSRPPPLGECRPPLVIPLLTVQTPSPTHSPSAQYHHHNHPHHQLGSPPPHKSPPSPDLSSPMSACPFPSSRTNNRRLHKDPDKSCSLELPCPPPLITVTYSDGECETDNALQCCPPGVPNLHKVNAGGGGCSSAAVVSTISTMSYLSPFPMAEHHHHASESNLSSSGYSSMASPGPSRCGSSNPLCLDMEDHGGGGGGGGGGGRRSQVLGRSGSNASERTDRGGVVA